MLISVEKINVAYGKILALRDVTINLEQGEIVAIIGSNGAGKTTLINAVSGVVPLRSGKIYFDGLEISKLPVWKIARKGIVQIPEGRKVFYKQTVLENLKLGAFPEKNSAKVHSLIDKMFALFPVLKERAHQLAGTLSGGEQQMLAIGRGLMAQPKILMFDEPSMGLAPIMVEKVFQVIRDINKQGITILLIEQNAKKSLQIANRAYVLETGRVVLADVCSKLLCDEKIRKAYLGK